MARVFAHHEGAGLLISVWNLAMRRRWGADHLHLTRASGTADTNFHAGAFGDQICSRGFADFTTNPQPTQERIEKINAPQHVHWIEPRRGKRPGLSGQGCLLLLISLSFSVARFFSRQLCRRALRSHLTTPREILKSKLAKRAQAVRNRWSNYNSRHAPTETTLRRQPLKPPPPLR